MTKYNKWLRVVLMAMAMFVAVPAVYIFSLGPVLWLCGARAGEWQKLPRGVQAVYGPIVRFPAVPMWYEHYLLLFLRQSPPWEPQDPELVLSPTKGVTLHVPKEWETWLAGSTAVELVSISPGNAVNCLARLEFTRGEPESMKQEDIDKLLQLEDAAKAKDTPEKQVNVVEIKPASGIGAYAVFSMVTNLTISGLTSGGTPVYTKVADGLFLTHGVLVRFQYVSADNLPQVLKFIGEGITVE